MKNFGYILSDYENRQLFHAGRKLYQIYEDVCNPQVFSEKRYNIRVSPDKMGKYFE
jgi:hypothetical protein